MDPVAESWELSVHPDGPSIVGSGEYEGLSFPEYLEKKGKGVLGTKGNTFEFFPILIKFIDAPVFRGLHHECLEAILRKS